MSGRPTRRLALAALASATLVVGAVPVQAQDAFEPRGIEIRAGVLAHDVPDLWSGFRLESGVDINGEVLLGRGLPMLGGSLRPAVGGSFSTSGTSKAYLDVRWEIEGPAGLFLGLGLGAAVHDGVLTPIEPDRKALGSRVLFHIPVEIGWRVTERHSVSIYFEHVSNAGLADHNEGLDSLGVRYGFRF